MKELIKQQIRQMDDQGVPILQGCGGDLRERGARKGGVNDER